MVTTIKSVCFIIFVALFTMSCTAYNAIESDEDDSAGRERMYSIREFVDLLVNKRNRGSSCLACAKTCVGAFSELGQSGMVVDVIDMVHKNAEKKATFCRLYERAYPPHLNGKLDLDAYNEIIKEAQRKNNMSPGTKAKCVLKGLKGDVVNTCLAIAEKAFG